MLFVLSFFLALQFRDSLRAFPLFRSSRGLSFFHLHHLFILFLKLSPAWTSLDGIFPILSFSLRFFSLDLCSFFSFFRCLFFSRTFSSSPFLCVCSFGVARELPGYGYRLVRGLSSGECRCVECLATRSHSIRCSCRCQVHRLSSYSTQVSCSPSSHI